MRPMYQKIREIVKYVEIAKKSQISAERKFWKMWFAFGNGSENQMYQTRPTCIVG